MLFTVLFYFCRGGGAALKTGRYVPTFWPSELEPLADVNMGPDF